jgi:glycosyltransferase involved in cell wall biosynthesis
MRVLVVSQYFPPESGACANRVHSFVRGLTAEGHDVVVLTEKPCYPEGVIEQEYRGGLFEKRVVDEVTVINTWVYTRPEASFLTRLLSYLTFMVMAVLGAGRAEGSFDVVLASSPPLTVGLAGWAVSKLKRARFVLDVRDLWPDVAVAMGEVENPVFIRVAKAVERFLYRQADGIMAATQGFCDHIATKVADSPPLQRIMNGTVPSTFDQSDRREDVRKALDVEEDAFVVTYAGIMGRAQGLGHILEAAAELENEERIAFHLRGDGSVKGELIEASREQSLDNVRFFDYCPLEKAAAHMAASDALLVPLANDELYRWFVPSKLFDSMASGRPVLLSVDGEAREVLKEANAGLYYPPEDGHALAERIQWLLEHPEEQAAMGENACSFARSHCTRRAQAQKMTRFLEANFLE